MWLDLKDVHFVLCVLPIAWGSGGQPTTATYINTHINVESQFNKSHLIFLPFRFSHNVKAAIEKCIITHFQVSWVTLKKRLTAIFLSIDPIFL